MCGISRALQMSARMTENRGVPGPSPVSPFNSPLDPSLFIGNPSGLPHSLGRASVSSDVEPTPGWDELRACRPGERLTLASARRSDSAAFCARGAAAAASRWSSTAWAPMTRWRWTRRQYLRRLGHGHRRRGRDIATDVRDAAVRSPASPTLAGAARSSSPRSSSSRGPAASTRTWNTSRSSGQPRPASGCASARSTGRAVITPNGCGRLVRPRRRRPRCAGA
jgi:hypothetical protein